MHSGGAAHDIATSNHCCNGPTVAQALADGGEVWPQTEAGLHGPRRRAKRCLDLIEDEQRPMAVGNVLNGLKCLSRRHSHHLGRQNHRRDLARVRTEEGLERVRGVAVELENLRVEAGRN
jgi:hypothetical protein